MSTYLDEKRRRIEQFMHYLRLMGQRAHKVAKDDCFIVFQESPSDDADARDLKNSPTIEADCLTTVGLDANGSFLGEEPSIDWQPMEFSDDPIGFSSGRECFGEDVPDDARPTGEPLRRFIQFAFLRDCFYLELPNNTVFPAEVQQIFQQRLGFYYAQNRLDLRWVRANWNDMIEWDPLQKIYVYRDEQSAAEDMAFVLYQVWRFPANWPW